jgi:hypothetical protein
MPPAALAIITGNCVARSIRMLKYEDAADLLSGGPGLIGDELHADQILGRFFGRLGVLHHLDAAALAAAASMDLRFDDDHAAAEALGDLAGFLRGECHFPARHGHAVMREDCLALILVNFH